GEATRAGGRLLMANAYAGADDEDYLLQPWVIQTYRDLFLNVGYGPETEETFTGIKDGRRVEVVMSLIRKGTTAAPGRTAGREWPEDESPGTTDRLGDPWPGTACGRHMPDAAVLGRFPPLEV